MRNDTDRHRQTHTHTGNCMVVVNCISSSPLCVGPLFSLHPNDENIRLEGKPFTGSLDAAFNTGRPHPAEAGWRRAVDFELEFEKPGAVGEAGCSGALLGLETPASAYCLLKVVMPTHF